MFDTIDKKLSIPYNEFYVGEYCSYFGYLLFLSNLK